MHYTVAADEGGRAAIMHYTVAADEGGQPLCTIQ